MPDAQIVGRVAIKILPDTSKFKEEAQAELKKAEKGLEVKAKVVLDGDDIKAQAQRIEAQAKQALKDITLSVNLDNEDSLRASIARIKGQLDSLGNTSITVDLNEGDLGAALDMLNERLDEIRTITLRVDESSQDSIKSAISRIDAELAKLRSVEIDVHVNEDELLAVREMLANDLRLDLTVDYDDDASLKQALAKINAELAKIAEVNLSVGMDEESLKKAQEELQKRLDLRAEVALNWDMAEAQATADRVKAMLADIKVNPKLDDKDVAKLKRQLEGALFQMEELKAKITPELDAVARRKVEREIDDLQDKIDGLKAKVEPETSKSAIAAVMLAMAKLTRDRVVNIFPKVSVSAYAAATTMLKALSGARVLGNIFEKLGNVLKNLDKSVPIVGTLATAIAGLAGWALSASSNLFALSASLAQIGALSLTLPGILAGVAIGMGVMVAALKDFNKVLPGVKKQLSELQDIISANFWAKAKEPIQDLIDSVFPTLQTKLGETSTAIGGFFASFSNNLKQVLTPQVLGYMFDKLTESINVASGGTDTFAAIIGKLGVIGSTYLPALAGWVVSIGEKFDAWLTAKGPAGIQAEIDAGIQSLKDLGGVLYETGGILAGISRAATEAGGSTLGMLRDTLKGVHEAIDSEGVQQKLVGLFTAAHQAMSNMSAQGGAQVKAFFAELAALLTEILPQVGTILGTAIGGIAEALSQPMVITGVQSLFNGIEQGVNAVIPALKPLGAALGAVMMIMGELASQLGPLVAAALTPLANAFVALTPSILPIIDLLGGTLTGIFQQLSPVIASLVPIIGSALGMAFQALSTILPVVVDAFGQILAIVAPLIEQLIAGLAPILPLVAEFLSGIVTAAMPLVEILLQILQAVLLPLIPVVQNLAATMLPLLKDAFDRLVQALMPFLEAIKGVIDFLMPVLAPAIQFIAELLIGSFVAAINGVALILEGFVEIFRGVWDMVKGIFLIFWGLFDGIWNGNWNTLRDGFSTLWNGIWTFLKGLWDTILGAVITWLSVGVLGAAKKGLTAIGNAFKSGWKSVQQFGKDAWNAISSGFSSFFSGLGSKAMSGLRSIKNFFTQGWSNVVSTTREKFTAMVTTVREWLGKAVAEVKKLPQKAKDGLKNIGSTLKNAGIQLIKGFISGITGMFGNVKDALGSLTDKLDSWKGPESLDKVLLVNAGQLVINGFIKGLESRYDAVRNSLRGLTDDVAETQFDAPTVGAFSASRGVTSAVSAALAGQAGGTTKVLNYYAAPGSSLGSEEDLFAAANRARMGW
ncbi:tape measure protein [Streptomyces phage BroPlease]|nr:tape measure protein [Streptomyces phage BroPlease]